VSDIEEAVRSLTPQARVDLLVGVERRLWEIQSKDEIRRRCEGSLYEFIKYTWPAVEPETQFIGSWVIRAICQHLEAVANGQITRLNINVFPGAMKSLLCAVFFPAWLWGPRAKPHLRFLCFA
jgi:hypothetical protein